MDNFLDKFSSITRFESKPISVKKNIKLLIIPSHFPHGEILATHVQPKLPFYSFLFSPSLHPCSVFPWFLYQMVTQNMLRTHEGKYYFSRQNIEFMTIKCLKQKLLLTCAPLSELPSNVSTMGFPGFTRNVKISPEIG